MSDYSKESPKNSKNGDNPKEWPKGTVLSGKRIAKVRPFSGAKISDMYHLLKLILKRNPD